ncbi:MAG: enoyl-CoA hydratase-related protein [Candidatus Kapabacteria bacterium]|nr:enoyl-CoA hydratase-related protein [Candidatus Kapabacteria bacterium]
MFETLLTEKKENYLVVTLNRPDKLNALNTQLFNELDEVIKSVELDDSIGAMILTGSGDKAFAAGADIGELNKSDQRSGKLFSEHGSKVMARLEQLRIPVIAAVNGFALGGGCELTMSCHIRFASENAKFGQPEVNLGIIPGYGGTQRLAGLVGISKAIELIISGNMINATEAARIGLVNAVFSKDELLTKTEEFVRLVLSKGRLAVNSAIEVIMASRYLSPAEGLAFESIKFGDLCATADFKEGTSAFLEKRKAEFINK